MACSARERPDAECAVQRRNATLSSRGNVPGLYPSDHLGVLIFLILLHSGKDTGLSGAFGIGGGGSGFGGGSMVERNLDRATIFFAILFAVNTIVLLKV